jgi:hypothetical protein
VWVIYYIQQQQEKVWRTAGESYNSVLSLSPLSSSRIFTLDMLPPAINESGFVGVYTSEECRVESRESLRRFVAVRVLSAIHVMCSFSLFISSFMHYTESARRFAIAIATATIYRQTNRPTLQPCRQQRLSSSPSSRSSCLSRWTLRQVEVLEHYYY